MSAILKSWKVWAGVGAAMLVLVNVAQFHYARALRAEAKAALAAQERRLTEDFNKRDAQRRMAAARTNARVIRLVRENSELRGAVQNADAENLDSDYCTLDAELVRVLNLARPDPPGFPGS